MSWDNENYRVILGCKDVKPYLLYNPEIDNNKPSRLLETGIDKTIYNCLKGDALNGKILIQCDVEIEEIIKTNYDRIITGRETTMEDLLENSCLTYDELDNYLKPDWKNTDMFMHCGYAIHLKNIDILEEPRGVSECDQYIRPALHLKHLPKNMCECYNYYGWWNILITLTPQEMCNVLNGEQTIIVRKEILEDRLKLLIESRWREDEDEE